MKEKALLENSPAMLFPYFSN
jgi:hypothetical protein